MEKSQNRMSSKVWKTIIVSQKDPLLLSNAGMSIVLLNKVCKQGVTGEGMGVDVTDVRAIKMELTANTVLVRNKANELMEVVILLPSAGDCEPTSMQEAMDFHNAKVTDLQYQERDR